MVKELRRRFSVGMYLSPLGSGEEDLELRRCFSVGM